MRRLAYIIIREDLRSPLVQSQCVNIISDVNKLWRSGKVDLIWFYRVDYFFRKNNPTLRDLRSRLKEAGIKPRFIPFLSNGFPLKWWALLLVLPQWLLGLFFVRFVLGIERFHCRSYHAGLLLRLGKLFWKIRYVFDPRSPFPEENIAAGRWGPKSFSKRVWKRLETWIINGSSCTILVSRPLTRFYVGVGGNSQFSEVPNNYPVSFETNTCGSLASTVKKFTLCYVGSFGNWNYPDSYLYLLKMLNESHAKNVNMLFVVSTDSEGEIFKKAKQIGVSREFFDVISSSQEEIPYHLAKCQFGVYLLDRKDPRLGVKTTEYLAMGLPMIVSENILGAAGVIQTERLGVLWDHTHAGVVRVEEWMRTVDNDLLSHSLRCRNFAKKTFAPQVIAGELITVYEKYIN